MLSFSMPIRIVCPASTDLHYLISHLHDNLNFVGLLRAQGTHNNHCPRFCHSIRSTQNRPLSPSSSLIFILIFFSTALIIIITTVVIILTYPDCLHGYCELLDRSTERVPLGYHIRRHVEVDKFRREPTDRIVDAKLVDPYVGQTQGK